MKIAIINIIKPQEWSRDGITEYTYEIARRLAKRHTVDFVYVTEKPKRVDNLALLYANTLFKSKIRKLAHRGYDIIHITNQELGFGAKILKKAGTKAKVITSIHDLMRMRIAAHKGVRQKVYNALVRGSVLDCFNYSDFIIFSASTVQKDASRIFNGEHQNWTTTLLGPTEEFRTTPIPKKPKRKEFVIGTVGALVPWKNQIYALKTAELLKKDKSYRFRIYGHGPEEQKLRTYITEHHLDNVEMLPFPKWEKFLETYDSFNLFFYPTVEEGSSLPLLNSQCRGLPAVIYKGNKVDSEVTKYCFVSKDEADAARIIKRIKEKGFEKKRRDAMLRYIRSFSWDRVTNETLGIYNKVLGQRRAATSQS